MASLTKQGERFRHVTQQLVIIPEGLPLEGTDFGVGTTIGGNTYEFVFSWNSNYRYYSLTIAGESGILWKGYLEEDTPFLVRNFNQDDVERPDAYVVVMDIDDEDNTKATAPTPSTLGERHQLFVMRGEVERT